MARRVGVLSDHHSEKYCLEYNSAPLGYYNAHYQELPPNPNLTGIKTPRYVASVNKPSLDVAAVNLGKLLHQNKQLSADFIMEKMLLNVKDFKPPQITLHPSLANTSAIASINNNVALISNGDSIQGQAGGQETVATQADGMEGYATPPLSRDPSIAGSSESEDEDRDDPRTSSVRFAKQQTAQREQRAQLVASDQSLISPPPPMDATTRRHGDSPRRSRSIVDRMRSSMGSESSVSSERSDTRLSRRLPGLSNIVPLVLPRLNRAQTGDSSSSSSSSG